MNHIDPERGRQIADDDRRHVFHSWAAQDKINPLPVATARGSTFYDYEGNGYLDFNSQMVNANLGHGHPKLIQAIKDQADRLATVAPGFAEETRTELARLIAEAAPGDLNHVFFTNGGADAVEHAVRMARVHTGRQKVMSAYRSYHGGTNLAITLTGEPRSWATPPADPGVVHFFGPYPYQSPFHSDSPEQETERALAHLEQQIILEGSHTIAAILMEPVVGGNGVIIPPPGYLRGLKQLCEKYGILYIADEVMIGFGRVGTMFAVEAFNVEPDLLTFAKGSNSGYVPLGGVILSSRVRDTFAQTAYPGGLTYSGHPLACAPGVATFEVFEEENLLAHINDMGERVVRPALEQMKEKYACVGDVRGMGLFWAIELVKDKKTREPLVPFAPKPEENQPMADYSAACRNRGVWPHTHFNRTHIAPPLTITEEDLTRGLQATDEAIGEIDHFAH